MTQNQITSRFLQLLVVPILLGAGLVVPFFVIEWINRRAFNEDFPLMLFSFMAIHALLIAFLTVPVLRYLHATKSVRALRPSQWACLLLATGLAAVYVGVVIDQLPCFMGVPNCD